jgi:hypothetical protein
MQRSCSKTHLDDECVEHAAAAHGLDALALDAPQLLPEQLAQVLRALGKLLLNKHLQRQQDWQNNANPLCHRKTQTKDWQHMPIVV